MMTSVLRDSLGGNCKTIMIATINPEAAHSDESLSTCRFAQRVSLIKNKASINEDLDPLQLIRRLKAELLNLREEISFLKGENSDEEQILTPSETEELMNNVRIYMNDPDIRAILNIGMHSLTHLLTLTHSYSLLLTHSLTHSLTLIHSLLLTQES
jgi:kinesin family protein 6/9